MTAFGRNLKAIPLKHQPAHLKFIHNQLPLGDRLFQRSPVKDSHLKLCPLCKVQEENTHHFLHSHKNPNRETSILLMVKTILKDDHPSRPAFASCLKQYFQSPGGQPIQFHNEKFPGHHYETLQEAANRETNVNWLTLPPSGIHIKEVAASLLHGHPKDWSDKSIGRTQQNASGAQSHNA